MKEYTINIAEIIYIGGDAFLLDAGAKEGSVKENRI